MKSAAVVEPRSTLFCAFPVIYNINPAPQAAELVRKADRGAGQSVATVLVQQLAVPVDQ